MNVALRLAIASAALTASGSVEADECNAELAKNLLGRPYSEELAQAGRAASGANVVRKIEPGKIYTMELRLDRLTIKVDNMNAVTEVYCG